MGNKHTCEPAYNRRMSVVSSYEANQCSERWDRRYALRSVGPQKYVKFDDRPAE